MRSLRIDAQVFIRSWYMALAGTLSAKVTSIHLRIYTYIYALYVATGKCNVSLRLFQTNFVVSKQLSFSI